MRHILVILVALLPWAKGFCGQPFPQAASGGVLEGRVRLVQNDGTALLPDPVKVYVLLSQEGAVWQEHSRLSPETVGGIYKDKQAQTLTFKEIKRIQKDRTKTPSEKANGIARLYLQSVDAALAAANDWVLEHPNRSWQLNTTVTDLNGLWLDKNLPPGQYEIVVRARIGSCDGVWEGGVSLDRGQTISLALEHPRFCLNRDLP